MSTDRQITLTESNDGRWTARQEPEGHTAHGETPAAALNALMDDEEPVEDPFDELMRATEDIHLSEDDLDTMIADSKDAWSSVG